MAEHLVDAAEISEEIASSANGNRKIVPIAIALGVIAVAGFATFTRLRRRKEELELWTEATDKEAEETAPAA